MTVFLLEWATAATWNGDRYGAGSTNEADGVDPRWGVAEF